jgi:uncharacterized protein YprB with RNaseH-like and TPR domain
MATSLSDVDPFARLAALRPVKRRPAHTTEPAGDAGELARLIGATVKRNRFGEHLAVRRWYAAPEQCFAKDDDRAARALRLLLPAQSRPASKSSAKSTARAGSPRDAERIFDPSQWLFLDTETTGLAGGSGTYAFRVGLAWWESSGLQVEQLFMRNFGEEHSLLQALEERMAERRVLVTFNGKSFDWPLLETRLRMTRSIAPRMPAAHLDLLHPARQLWRPRLGSVRLAELEQRVLRTSPGSRLDWSRDFDVDSSAIPEIYFNFVRGLAAAPLVPVFQHNQMDLRGLAALAGHVLEVLSEPREMPATAASNGTTQEFSFEMNEPLDVFSLSRLLARRGESVRARKMCQAALAAGLPVEHDRAARGHLARLAKRAGDLPAAIEMWESVLTPAGSRPAESRKIAPERSLTLERTLSRETLHARGGLHAGAAGGSRVREMLEACEQLAIYCEHRAKSIQRATQLTRHGLALVRDLSAGTFLRGKWEARFERRLGRLERKAACAESGFPA